MGKLYFILCVGTVLLVSLPSVLGIDAKPAAARQTAVAAQVHAVVGAPRADMALDHP